MIKKLLNGRICENYLNISFIKNTLFCLIFVLFISCIKNPTLNEKITGTWMIEELEYKNLNYKDSLNYNMLFFKNSRKVKIPEISIYRQESSFWNIEKNNGMPYLVINSFNEIFDGKYEIEFIKDDQRKMLGAKLKSQNVNILAYKFGQNYLEDGLYWQ
nr:hypothetical protein [uncultured Psychroserpens sp.]